jgi:non-specific serine/threonine protein kinase
MLFVGECEKAVDVAIARPNLLCYALYMGKSASTGALPASSGPSAAWTVTLSPLGRLAIEAGGGGSPLAGAFINGTGHGLLRLGADEVGTPLSPVLSYWRDFAARYVASLCAVPNLAEGASKPAVPPPSTAELQHIAIAAPPMVGAEYLSADMLARLWQQTDQACDVELRESRLTVQQFLQTRNKAWNLVGRVHFNLAENRKDQEAPFAFLATFTHKLSTAGKAQHLPLGKALQEYAGARNRARLLSLLLPVQRATEHCPWLKAMVDSGAIYHPLRWTPVEAMQFLRDVPRLESAGVIVRMPTSWRMNRPARPQVTATVGSKAPSHVGLNVLLDFDMAVVLDGETLTRAEVEALLEHTAGLALIRGKWVEVDRERLSRTLERFHEIARRAADDGLSFAQAMRLLAGAVIESPDKLTESVADWGQTIAGPWLAEALASLRQPGAGAHADPGSDLKGTLRAYQQAGVTWLNVLARLRLGACLADDMGLGKTIQVIALLLVLKRHKSARDAMQPSILVAPASLLANWASEIARFAPSLTACIAHPSAMAADALKALDAQALAATDLVITSYGTLLRSPNLTAIPWQLAILDEAQAIKNAGAKQTRVVKQITAQSRIALTGTPIENRLGDLWSIFDFLNPGLLGSAKDFTAFTKRLAESENNAYAPLRELTRPYILRRLKTDKSVIADLPDKTELKSFCALSHRQAALYAETVKELADRLKSSTDDMARKGLVLATLMRLKQICNHPSHWLGDGAWTETDSGKLMRLRDIIEEVAARQEKVLVFTQFKEIAEPLAAFLARLFGRTGNVLTGDTAVRKRKDLVLKFQQDDSVPFFVLSVKAGGVGLNLTAASHVIHFDRWWNPAVENQATDRAFRIGQKRNVLVHKFICRGTVEDRIDQMIEDKQKLAADFLGSSRRADAVLTEMKDEDLLRLVALDLNAALQEAA